MLAQIPYLLLVVANPLALAPAGGTNQQAIHDLVHDQVESLQARETKEVYQVEVASQDTWRAPNPAQGMSSTFGSAGVEVAGPSWMVGISLEAWGREGALLPVEDVEPCVDGQRVEYIRSNITEWYINEARGLEQGFMVETSPRGEGPLRFVLVVKSGLSIEVMPEGTDARFKGEDGSILHYAGLRAWDATGSDLPARLCWEEGRLVIEVEDEGAVYPLDVDPLIATEIAKVTASDVAPSDSFGYSVSISGDTAVVGAPGDVHSSTLLGGGLGEGSAYLFERQQGSGGAWIQTNKLVASDAAPATGFGISVSISGDTLAIGSPFGGASFDGSVYVFERNSGGVGAWGEVTTFSSSDIMDNDGFGGAVAIAGDTLVVGAPFADPVGSAYVFERNNGGLGSWGEVAKLVASDGSFDDRFGQAVAIWGDTVVVGAFFANHGTAVDLGAAYVFDRNQGGSAAWGEVAKLLDGTASFTVGFGISVGLSGDIAVVGAPSDGANFEGAALVFERNHGGSSTWGEIAKLKASDGQSNDLFGFSVAAFGDEILVGSEKSSHGGLLEAGSVYLFQRNFGGPGAWAEVAELTASDAGAADEFGRSVAIMGGTVLVGGLEDKGFTIGRVEGLAFDPGTNTLYGSERDSLVTIDVLSGRGTPVGAFGFDDVQALAFDPTTNTLYGSDDATKQLITIDTATGAGTAVGPHGFPEVLGLAFDPTTSTLYGTKRGASSVWKLIRLDTTTGAGTDIGTIGFSNVYGLAFDTAANTLYGTVFDTLITIDPVTGVGTTVGAAAAFGWTKGAALDPLTGILYGSQINPNDLLVSIDTLTAAVSAVGPFQDTDSGAAYVIGLNPAGGTYCTAGLSASGCQASISAVGVASATAPSGFDLSASSLEGGRDGLFFYGTNARQVSSWGNGTSFQCVAPPVRRGGLLAGTGVPGSCSGLLIQDLNARWCPTCPKPHHNPGPGAIVQAQLWYLDPLSTSNQATSLSDAVEFCVAP